MINRYIYPIYFSRHTYDVPVRQIDTAAMAKIVKDLILLVVEYIIIQFVLDSLTFISFFITYIFIDRPLLKQLSFFLTNLF